jgi:hypothetical protein
MKTNLALALLLGVCVALFVVFTGCEGPQGPPGNDGSDGNSPKFEGFAQDIKCGDCHNPDIDTTYYLWARRYQWEHSLHAYGGDIERNGPDCAGCHTTEGFIQRWKNSWASQSVTQKDNPSPPGCFACHSPHSRGNFSLRDANPVSLPSYIVGVPAGQFDYGKGNLCARCHQPRPLSGASALPDPTKTAMTDTLTITSSRWYTHYGMQGQMLMGTGGFEFQGYTYRGSSPHSTNAGIKQEGCIACHMASQVYPPDLGSGRGGGHTMKIRYSSDETESDTLFVLKGCNQSGCHGANAFTKTSILAAEKAIDDSLHALETLLIQKNWITTSGTVRTPLKVVPAAKAGALYNYFFVEHDASRGMHNTKYTQDLINSSLQALRTP